MKTPPNVIHSQIRKEVSEAIKERLSKKDIVTHVQSLVNMWLAEEEATLGNYNAVSLRGYAYGLIDGLIGAYEHDA